MPLLKHLPDNHTNAFGGKPTNDQYGYGGDHLQPVQRDSFLQFDHHLFHGLTPFCSMSSVKNIGRFAVEKLFLRSLMCYCKSSPLLTGKLDNLFADLPFPPKDPSSTSPFRKCIFRTAFNPGSF